MNLKRYGVALVAALALGAVTAGSATAAATTTVEPWRTGASGGGTTVLTGTQAVTASLTTTTVFASEIGSTPLELQSTELECVSCTILNESGGAKGEGKLNFKNVTVVTPSDCTVSGGAILTNPLKFDATYMIGRTAYVQVLPASGTSLFTFTLSGTGTCPPGTYKVTGSLYVQAANETGVYATGQGVTFSKAINETAGGVLALGTREASLTGAARFEAGGQFFGVE